MPLPALAIAGIAAGASQLASSIGNNMASASMNEATREWNEAMYSRQRQDALLDWNMQNEYNSPKAQMERFKAAGLNPNLIYGQSNEAPAVRSTDIKPWNPQPADYSGIGRAVGGAINTYQDLTAQNEQLKNMEAQRTNMQLDAVLKTAEIASKNLQNAKNLALFDTSLATAEELLRSISTGTDIKISQEARNAALHAPNLLAAFERVANIGADTELKRAQLKNVERTGVLQAMEIGLRKLGMSYSDPLWSRLLAQFADGKPLPDVVKQMWSQFRQVSGGTGVSDVIAKYLGVDDFGFGPKESSLKSIPDIKRELDKIKLRQDSNRRAGLQGIDKYFQRKY